MTDTIREINSRPIWWKDKQGFVHSCEGSDLHRDVRVFWTLCRRDVPANEAFHPGNGETLTCATCIKQVVRTEPVNKPDMETT